MAEKFDEEIRELQDWLIGRVSDENDIVVDEAQEEFGEQLASIDDALGITRGSDLYQENMKILANDIEVLKKEGCSKTRVGMDKQKITDGIRACWYGGHKDAQSQPHGEGMLKYENSETFTGTFDHGVLNRKGTFKTKDCLNIEGTWKDGLMEGEMRVETFMGGWIEGYYSKGVPHGFQREFGTKTVANTRQLKFFGRYHRGIRTGFCWQGLLGGGFICGKVDNRGDFTGPDIAFIYPDFKNALKGHFKEGLLEEARPCHLIGCHFEKGMAFPRFSEPTSGDLFRFESPSRVNIANFPLLRDPWEENRVFVAKSNLPQGGEGLFAKSDIAKNELICLYNGIRLKTATYASKHAPHSDYRIRLNADVDLDIPDDFIRLSQYRATLGHKVNHSNLPNSDWAHVEHPRFGLIRGIYSRQNIAKNEEILINYHINLGDSPDWYRQVWLRHQREHKKKNDESILRFLDRYYDDTGKRVDLNFNLEDFVVPEPKGVLGLEDLDSEDDGNDDETEMEMTKKALGIQDRSR